MRALERVSAAIPAITAPAMAPPPRPFESLCEVVACGEEDDGDGDGVGVGVGETNMALSVGSAHDEGYGEVITLSVTELGAPYEVAEGCVVSVWNGAEHY